MPSFYVVTLDEVQRLLPEKGSAGRPLYNRVDFPGSTS